MANKTVAIVGDEEAQNIFEGVKLHEDGATELRLVVLTQQEQDIACPCSVGKGEKPEDHPAVKACKTCKGKGKVRAIQPHALEIHVADANGVLSALVQSKSEPAAEAAKVLGSLLSFVGKFARQSANGEKLVITPANAVEELAL